MLLNDQWIIEEIKKEMKSFLEINKNENNISKTVQYSKTNIKGGRL